MTTQHGLTGLRELPPGCVISIGNFDGVHLGHRRILESAARAASESASPLPFAVVTFEPHPLTVLRPAIAPPRLTPPPIKQALIEAAGADHLVILPPAREVLDLTAERFWAILRDEVRPARLVEGTSFNFGKNRLGNIDRLREWAAGDGIVLEIVPAVEVPLLDLHVVSVSSSLIRWLLSYGRVRDAAICLGRPHALRGEVIPGHHRGKSIGVPTANLRCDDQLIPADGVYAGRCALDGRTFPAAVSIGTLPTFGGRQLQVEAHLIGFSGDLYGCTLQIDLLDWLRDQWKFTSVETLTSQITRDLSATGARTGLQVPRPIAAP